MSLLSPELKAFLAVVEQGTVLHAASLVGITQTGVTQRIRRLEKSLGTTLFTRSRSGMRPTDEGQALLLYCRGARELEGQALSRIQGLGDQQVIEVAITGPSSLMRSRLIPQAVSLYKSWPGLRFRFDVTDDDSAMVKLKRGISQLAILPETQVLPEFDSKRLKPEEYFVVVPKRWSHRKLADVIREESIVDFGPTDDMTFAYLRAFGFFKSARADRHFANNTDALASMVGLGIGYTVLAKEFAEPLLRHGKLAVLEPNQVFQFRMALAWYPRPEMPAYFRALVRALS